MATITAIILAKNEEQRIADVLSHLSWTDEKIVVDNGSSDHTAEIAKKHGAVVLSISKMDFSFMRNESAKKATGDWLLYIDTDEEISQELQKEILTVIQNSSYDAFFIKRKNFYMNKEWPHIDGMIRLIRKKSLKKWVGKIHESAFIHGEVGVLECYLIHKTHTTLEDMVEQTNDWSDIEADLRISANHPPVVSWRLFRVFLTGFFDSFFKQGGWKVGTVGIIESIYQGFSMFLTYAKLWEKQKT